MPVPLLQLNGLCKSFGDVVALKPLTLQLEAGEVLGLIGENGAGKSTLIKLLSGVYQPDAGTLRWKGSAARFATPHDALRAGIATIHQELAYFGHLTVAENLLPGEVWPRFSWGGIRWAQLFAEARRRLNEFEVDVPPDRLFRELSAAQRQEIAIVRALRRRAQLLILDEPTASLSEREVEQLFRKLAVLRQARVAIIYVSHRLDEILKLTDRVAVLRDGDLVAAYQTKDVDMGRLVRDMVGRPLDQVYPHSRSAALGPPLLELKGVTRTGMFEDINLVLRGGEITGLAGLVGCGRSELARAIFGLYPIHAGEMRLGGRRWVPRGPQAALQAGLAYVPEERKRQGFVLEHSLGDSISIGLSDMLSRFGLIRRGQETNRIAQVLQAYGIRARSPDQPIGTLSGGNQQKALLGRWLEREPQVLVLDEPTRGVDVGAKAEIHALIDRLAGAGKAVLLISSDLPEVLGMSDRVLVMHRGRLAAQLEGEYLTQEDVIRAASGLNISPPTSPPV